ncbi:hypothetical protein GCM10009133_36100 [Cocleimonas flava]|uniref:Heat shock protein HslJ n=1 Tax=Cocleimonas flava TaxID=634765 RepID=A0A4R1F9K3_9GAMM|nr:META domain-containing protein [Cocleimonas flava]TCJ88548.1 heat shock protein HslJ [Cocleimonas flava]
MNQAKNSLLLSLLFIAALLISACSDNDKKSDESATPKESAMPKEDSTQNESATQKESTPKKESVAKVENATISGSVNYSESATPPAESKLYVRLNNVSLADASSVNMEELVFDLSDLSIPVNYEFSLPKDQLKANEQYAVRAEIRGKDDGLLWTTDTNNPVDAAKTSQTLDEIMMIEVKPVTAGDSILDLISVVWEVNNINGTGVIANSKTNLTFAADGKISGLSGCNNYSGDYKIHNGKLSIGKLAVTKKACQPEVNGQEIQFLNAIASVDDFSFNSEGFLVLKGNNDKTITAQRP